MAIATVPTVTDPRELALLKAVGLDRVNPEQRELALNIAQRYDLDLLLKHLVMIDGRPYVTRDGLLHIAHRSGQLNGMETSEPVIVDDYWRSTCSVYRKDMERPFTYTGRYPTKGGNAKFAPEMAVKVGEVMALRRAFDVAAPTAEERWDMDVPVPEPQAKTTLAEKAAERAATARKEVLDTYVESDSLTGAQVKPVIDALSKRAAIETPAEPVTEEPPVPAGLSKRQFVDALAANNVTPEYAMAVRAEVYPDTAKELTDAERGSLLELLLKDVTPQAESEPLFTEGEWAPTELAAALMSLAQSPAPAPAASDTETATKA